MDTIKKLALAMEAIECAYNVMDYCSGDAWERECTEDDRSRFDDIKRILDNNKGEK